MFSWIHTTTRSVVWPSSMMICHRSAGGQLYPRSMGELLLIRPVRKYTELQVSTSVYSIRCWQSVGSSNDNPRQ